jgi:hypothetical protein
MAAALSNLHPAVDLKLLDQITNSGGHPYSLCAAAVSWQESSRQFRDDGSIRLSAFKPFDTLTKGRRSSETVEDDRRQLVGRRLKDIALEREPFHAGKQFRKKVAPVPDFPAEWRGRPRNTTGQSIVRCPAQREITSAAKGTGQRARRRRKSE